MKLEDVEPFARMLLKQFKPFCERIEIAGSIRRKCKNVGDIELVCIPRRVQTGLFAEDVQIDPGFVAAVNKFPAVKGSPEGKYTQRSIMVNGDTVALDLFMTSKEIWGSIFAIRTGSADFSHYVLAKAWQKKGWKSEEGVLINEAGERKTFKEESELFDFLGIRWVDPTERQEWGEREKALFYRRENSGIPAAANSMVVAFSAGLSPAAGIDQTKHAASGSTGNAEHKPVDPKAGIGDLAQKSCWTCQHVRIAGQVFPCECQKGYTPLTAPEWGCDEHEKKTG